MSATAAVSTSQSVPRRTFVPQNLDVAQWEQIQPLADALMNRTIRSADELEKWLLDFSEFHSVIDEYGSRRYIDKSCHTEDPEIEKRFFHYVENIEPKFKPIADRLQRKFLESPYRAELEKRDKRYHILARHWQADVDIYRDQNVPLETESTRIITEYDKVCGAMMVQFRGAEYTQQQLARFGEEPDRATREEAWRTGTARRLQDREKIEELFDQLLPLRQRIAQNADLADYRQYIWKAYKRFDYTPEDTLRFGDAIAKTVVPLVDQLDRERARDLKIDRLRPWDLTVDPMNRPPLRPFSDTDIDGFVAKTKSIFQRLSPELAEDFDSLRRNKNLDLGSRKGQAARRLPVHAERGPPAVHLHERRGRPARCRYLAS
jgi:oligoendopeptidase F